MNTTLLKIYRRNPEEVKRILEDARDSTDITRKEVIELINDRGSDYDSVINLLNDIKDFALGLTSMAAILYGTVILQKKRTCLYEEAESNRKEKSKRMIRDLTNSLE